MFRRSAILKKYTGVRSTSYTWYTIRAPTEKCGRKSIGPAFLSSVTEMIDLRRQKKAHDQHTWGGVVPKLTIQERVRPNRILVAGHLGDCHVLRPQEQHEVQILGRLWGSVYVAADGSCPVSDQATPKTRRRIRHVLRSKINTSIGPFSPR